MANKKSSAAQAIKDMLELGLDVAFFIGSVNAIHKMNAEIGIITKERTMKRVKEVKVTVSIKTTVRVKPHYDRKPFIINPDGTISIDGDWDFK